MFLGSRFAFTPQILAGVLGCLCLCARSACTPAILAGVCGVFLHVQVLTSARQFWHEFVVCVFGYVFCSLPAMPGSAAQCACLCVGSDLGLCRAVLGVVRALRVSSTRPQLLPSIWSCAVVVDGSLPLWRFLWPPIGALRLVKSSRSPRAGWLSRRCGAFGYLALMPPDLLGGCTGACGGCRLVSGGSSSSQSWRSCWP